MIFGNSAPIPEKPENPATVAILSSSNLALWLAVRFANAGHNPQLIVPPAELPDLRDNEFSLKEDRAVISHKIRFKADYKLNAKPDLLISACTAPELRRHLTLLTPDKLVGVPVLNCAIESDTSYLAAFLKSPVTPTYFTGCISRAKNHLTPLNHTNSLTLSLKESHPVFEKLEPLFASAGIEISGNPDDRRNFWKWFIPRTAAALLAGLNRQNIYTLMKNEPQRKQLEILIAEMSELAAADEVLILAPEMLHAVYAFPPTWQFSLQSSEKQTAAAEFSRLTTFLQNCAETASQSIPFIRRYLEEYYNKILA